MTDIWNELENIRGTFTNSTYITKELLEAMLDQHKKVLKERDALAAHVGRLEEAGDSLREPWNLDEILGASTRRRVMGWDEARRCAPTTPLARRDASMKAEALDKEAALGEYHTIHSREEMREKAETYRREAEGCFK